jgi:hypothetical protein
VRGWATHWPARLLGALPTRAWLKRRRRFGLDVLAPLWRHVADKRPAPQRRGQWTWVWDDAVFHTSGEQWGGVGRWWSGQQKRVLSGIDGLVLRGGIGDGRLVVPVDLAMRRPAPVGPGAPGRDKLRWARVRLADRLAACRRGGVELPAPMVGADRGLSDAKRMQPGHATPQGTVLVERKQSYTFPWPDGHKVKGHALIHGEGWRWRQHPWEGIRMKLSIDNHRQRS